MSTHCHHNYCFQFSHITQLKIWQCWESYIIFWQFCSFSQGINQITPKGQELIPECGRYVGFCSLSPSVCVCVCVRNVCLCAVTAFIIRFLCNAPLWMWWCHNLTLTMHIWPIATHHWLSPSSSFRYHLGTQIHRDTAGLLKNQVWGCRRKEGLQSNPTVSDVQTWGNWANCCLWCWNMFNCTYGNKCALIPSVAEVRMAVSRNTAEAYFQEVRLFK